MQYSKYSIWSEGLIGTVINSKDKSKVPQNTAYYQGLRLDKNMLTKLL